MNIEKPEPDWSELEVYKIEFDYLKHLSTICTGSILLIVAFLEKLFAQPKWKPAVAIALCSFVLSISLCVISQIAVIDKISEKNSVNIRNRVQKWTIDLLVSAAFMYIIGIISLVLFGLINLF